MEQLSIFDLIGVPLDIEYFDIRGIKYRDRIMIQSYDSVDIIPALEDWKMKHREEFFFWGIRKP